MGIEIAWVDETHKTIAAVSDAMGVITRLAMSRWPDLSNHVCLRFVEPWGDAVFNQTQIPILLTELRAELAATSDAKVAEQLGKVVQLVERSVDQTHTYIKFIGD